MLLFSESCRQISSACGHLTILELVLWLLEQFSLGWGRVCRVGHVLPDRSALRVAKDLRSIRSLSYLLLDWSKLDHFNCGCEARIIAVKINAADVAGCYNVFLSSSHSYDTLFSSFFPPHRLLPAAPTLACRFRLSILCNFVRLWCGALWSGGCRCGGVLGQL